MRTRGEEESFWHFAVPFYFDGSVQNADDVDQLIAMLPEATISDRLRDYHCGMDIHDPAATIADELERIAR